MSEKVLFVDDDANVLSAYRRQLRKLYQIDTACGGAEGLAALKNSGPYAVVISDMQMPEMDGLEFLGAVRKAAPDTVRMMLTGNADQKTAVDAVNEGNILRFFSKPCPPEEIGQGIEAGFQQYRLVRAERELLEQTLAGSVKVLIDVLSLVDPQAFGHATRMRGWTRRLIKALKLTNGWQLDLAAMLSPIGQLTLPPEVRAKLHKGDRLSTEEQEIVGHVPEASRDLIANIPRLKDVSEIVFFQNKGYDGEGFPAGSVAGDKIPEGARLLKVLIDLGAAVGNGEPSAEAFQQLEKQASRYDPKFLAAARQCLLVPPKGVGPTAEPWLMDLAISQLQIGDKLTSDIQSEQGQLILSAGHEMTRPLIQKLCNLHKVSRLKEPVGVSRVALE